MALGQMQYDSYLNNTTQPQQNQYLSGDPSTDTQAQTRWMDPNQASSTTGINGGGGAQQVPQASQTTSTPQNGTLLGAVGSGNWMPQGYDQTKWNDPTKSDPKYDIGHILSQYQPGSAGLDQAMNQLSAQGYSRVGKDSIYRHDVGVIDVGKSFGSGDPNQMAWQWLPQDQGGQQQSLMGSQQQSPNNFMQWIMSLFGGMNPGSNNSTGGFAQPIARNTMPMNRPNPMGGNINPVPFSYPGGQIPSSQYNPYGPGGSSDNFTGPAGNYPVGGPVLPFTSYMNPAFSANYDPRVNTPYGVAQ